MDEMKSPGPHRTPLRVTCRATAKSTGKRCKRAPIPGGSVCVKHGGAAPQVRRAADRRLAMSGAKVALWRAQLSAPGGLYVGHPTLTRPTRDEVAIARRRRAIVAAADRGDVDRPVTVYVAPVSRDERHLGLAALQQETR